MDRQQKQWHTHLSLQWRKQKLKKKKDENDDKNTSHGSQGCRGDKTRQWTVKRFLFWEISHLHSRTQSLASKRYLRCQGEYLHNSSIPFIYNFSLICVTRAKYLLKILAERRTTPALMGIKRTLYLISNGRTTECKRMTKRAPQMFLPSLIESKVNPSYQRPQCVILASSQGYKRFLEESRPAHFICLHEIPPPYYDRQSILWFTIGIARTKNASPPPGRPCSFSFLDRIPAKKLIDFYVEIGRGRVIG